MAPTVPRFFAAAGQQHAFPQRGHVGRAPSGLHQAGGVEGGTSIGDREPSLPHYQSGIGYSEFTSALFVADVSSFSDCCGRISGFRRWAARHSLLGGRGCVHISNASRQPSPLRCPFFGHRHRHQPLPQPPLAEYRGSLYSAWRCVPWSALDGARAPRTGLFEQSRHTSSRADLHAVRRFSSCCAITTAASGGRS